MQYALTELFEQRQGRTLTVEAYAAIGGAAGALARRAEELYQEQGDQGRESIHQMFLRLVTAGELAGNPVLGATADGPAPPDIRKRVPRAELLSAAADPELLDDIVDTFAGYRLLSLDHHPATRQPTVEVAHEAILREWDRLRGWLEESQAELALHRQLIRATAEWMETEGDWSFLLRGSRLSQFEAWATDTRIVLTDEEQAYLESSLANREERAAVDRERHEHEARLEQRASRRLRALVAVMALALVIAVGLSIAAIAFARQADEQRRQAEVRELTSAALINLESNPERSLLLALEAARTTYSVDGTILPEVEEILHRAIQADRNQITIPEDGAVAFSPDGKMLAMGDEAGELMLWDATTGKLLRTLTGHRSAIMTMAFSPDGNYLATGGSDPHVKIWDVSTNWAIMNLDGYQGTVLDIAYSPGGNQLATAGEDGLIRVWDMTSMATEVLVDGFLARPVLLHQSEPTLILQAPTEVSGVAFSSDGQRLAAYIPGASITVWDVNLGQQLLELSGVSDYAAGVAFSPDDEYIVGPSGTLGVTLWNANTGQEVISLFDSSPIARVAFSRDGAYLGTAARDGTATLWDMATGQQAFRISGQSTGFNFIAFSQDGQQMASGGDNETTRIWDLASSGRVELFTTAAHEGEVYDVVYDPEGTRFASAGEDGSVKIWNAATGELIHNLPGRSDGVHFPAFSPDGKRLASANILGGVTIWDSDSGKELLYLSGDAPTITTIAFSPDGRHLAAAGGQEGNANIWDATSGEVLASFRNETALMRLVYSPDSRQIWT